MDEEDPFAAIAAILSRTRPRQDESADIPVELSAPALPAPLNSRRSNSGATAARDDVHSSEAQHFDASESPRFEAVQPSADFPLSPSDLLNRTEYDHPQGTTRSSSSHASSRAPLIIDVHIAGEFIGNLPVRRTDAPYTLAQRFANRHHLPVEAISRLAKLVQSRLEAFLQAESVAAEAERRERAAEQQAERAGRLARALQQRQRLQQQRLITHQHHPESSSSATSRPAAAQPQASAQRRVPAAVAPAASLPLPRFSLTQLAEMETSESSSSSSRPTARLFTPGDSSIAAAHHSEEEGKASSALGQRWGPLSSSTRSDGTELQNFHQPEWPQSRLSSSAAADTNRGPAAGAALTASLPSRAALSSPHKTSAALTPPAQLRLHRQSPHAHSPLPPRLAEVEVAPALPPRLAEADSISRTGPITRNDTRAVAPHAPLSTSRRLYPAHPQTAVPLLQPVPTPQPRLPERKGKPSSTSTGMDASATVAGPVTVHGQSSTPAAVASASAAAAAAASGSSAHTSASLSVPVRAADFTRAPSSASAAAAAAAATYYASSAAANYAPAAAASAAYYAPSASASAAYYAPSASATAAYCAPSASASGPLRAQSYYHQPHYPMESAAHLTDGLQLAHRVYGNGLPPPPPLLSGASTPPEVEVARDRALSSSDQVELAADGDDGRRGTLIARLHVQLQLPNDEGEDDSVIREAVILPVYSFDSADELATRFAREHGLSTIISSSQGSSEAAAGFPTARNYEFIRLLIQEQLDRHHRSMTPSADFNFRSQDRGVGTGSYSSSYSSPPEQPFSAMRFSGASTLVPLHHPSSSTAAQHPTRGKLLLRHPPDVEAEVERCRREQQHQLAVMKKTAHASPMVPIVDYHHRTSAAVGAGRGSSSVDSVAQLNPLSPNKSGKSTFALTVPAMGGGRLPQSDSNGGLLSHHTASSSSASLSTKRAERTPEKNFNSRDGTPLPLSSSSKFNLRNDRRSHHRRRGSGVSTASSASSSSSSLTSKSSLSSASSSLVGPLRRVVSPTSTSITNRFHSTPTDR